MPRSPAYPAVNLRVALEKTSALYRRERRNLTPVSLALQDIGYSAGSGQGMVVISAMIKFGLLTDEGVGESRRVRVTDAGVRLSLDTRGESEERPRLLREAALAPPIHQELWTKYGLELPGDSSLSYYLRADRGFSEAGVRDLIKEYKATLDFGGLTTGDTLSAEDQDKDLEGQTQAELVSPIKGTEAQPSSGRTRVIQIPISLGEWATLQIPHPMTEEMWNQMEAILKAMKPGIVQITRIIETLGPVYAPADHEGADG